MAGEYTALVLAAQADQDQQSRQRAMDMIAVIAPHCGGDNRGADAMAAPILAQLYPPPEPEPEPVPPADSGPAPDWMTGLIARYTEQAIALARTHVRQ